MINYVLTKLPFEGMYEGKARAFTSASQLDGYLILV